ncbi:hypothetical protein [Glycomyces buryatensis]|uniref:Uncharacterized protein n=1 Tax=Glycomyces buryatensis TaxID=2570927 RepID=A0A4S8QKB4_9ACTN|nr:hypothetical protein [Glycomyces buryatensis]THV43435.1 hypothetical protein FAB82_01820 [Glycomyces buryatensis]
MDRSPVPDDYENRLADSRAAAGRLPASGARDSALRALEAAPNREAHEAAQRRAERAGALIEELTQTGYDGTDPERIAWVRLDHTGGLVALAFSPTIDRLSNPIVGEAIGEAWAAADTARAEAARSLERAAADLNPGAVPDPLVAEFRRQLAPLADERFEHTTDDDLCSAEVTVECRLTVFKFLVPNATLDNDCESLAEEATATIKKAQERAATRLSELAERVFG